MNTIVQYKQVNPAHIDLSDNSYAINPFTETSPDTIAHGDKSAYSVFHPPLLLKKQTNSYIIVSGKKCLVDQSKENKPSIPVLVIKEEFSNKQSLIYRLLLQHRLLQGQLSSIEQATFFKKALPVFNQKNLSECIQLLGLKPKYNIQREAESLLQLDITVQRCLHEGIIPLRSVKKLKLLNRDDQKEIVDLIRELRLGGSKQQKSIAGIIELTKRLQISCQDLINQWKKTLPNSQKNTPQKASALLTWLELKCHPRSKTAEQEFKKFCKQLKLPTTMRLSHSPAFEEEQVTLSIDFSSKEQLERLMPQLKDILQATLKN